MKKVFGKIAYSILLLLFFEAAFRLFIALSFSITFFRPSDSYLHYYPELRPLLNLPEHAKDGFRILVLGGSVLYTDTIPIQIGEKTYRETFCNVPYLLAEAWKSEKSPPSQSISVYSLAQPAHNSLDSRYKYEYLADKKFEVVFLYHGINDIRANNISKVDFDLDYRHIEFYNDLFVLRRHPEIDVTVIPFFFDFLFQKIAIGTGLKTVIPREHFEDFESDEAQFFLKEGKEIKSEQTFRRNVKWIADETRKRKARLELNTFAWYLPENYSLRAFQDQSLDYDGQIFPTEIYGLPRNVKKGLIAHNDIIRELAAVKYPHVHFTDLEKVIPKQGLFFDDICHLSDAGCEVIGEALKGDVLGYTLIEFELGEKDSIP